jgi:alanine-glyoxylate transaminase/(R)-3-amino-2-methylpropionate-pyruvate transaminase
MATAPAPAPVDLPQLPPFEHTPAPYDGPPKEEVLSLRKRFLSPGAPRRPRPAVGEL